MFGLVVTVRRGCPRMRILSQGLDYRDLAAMGRGVSSFLRPVPLPKARRNARGTRISVDSKSICGILFLCSSMTRTKTNTTRIVSCRRDASYDELYFLSHHN